jgi:hypothetical protein
MEIQFFSDNKRIRIIRLSRIIGKTFYDTELMKQIEESPYMWHQGDEKYKIDAVIIPDDQFRWKLQESILISLLLVVRINQTENETPRESLANLTDVLLQICDKNIDAIRIC